MTSAIITTFIAVFLMVGTLLMAVFTEKDTPAAVLRRRLRRLAQEQKSGVMPDDLRHEIIRETPPMDRFLARLPVLCDLERHLDHAGLKVKVTYFIYMVIAATLMVFILFYVVFSINLSAYLASGEFKLIADIAPFKLAACIAILAALCVPLGTCIYIKYKKNQRLIAFTEQMPDILMMISRSLRAGHAMNSAIELVGNETVNPAGELFKMAYEQQKLGLRLLDTLTNMTNRIESLDLRFFITAVSINSEIGGNLAEILDKLADTIRERIKIRRQIRVYTAQGRLSGYVLAVMPLAAFLMMNVMLPGYEKLLFTEKLGNIMLLTAFSMQIAGFMIIKKIINIRI